MPAAVALPAIVGGVTSLAGGAMQAHAAGSAARAQQQSADRALALNREMYNQQRDMMSPYISAGQSSLARLMDGYWNHRSYGAAAPQGPGAVAGVPMATNANQVGAGAFAQAMGPAAALGARFAPGGSLARPQMGAPMAQGGGLVPMLAPDGSRAMVPAQHVDMLIGQGAQRIA
jgi:hypothetical protein